MWKQWENSITGATQTKGQQSSVDYEEIMFFNYQMTNKSIKFYTDNIINLELH